MPRSSLNLNDIFGVLQQMHLRLNALQKTKLSKQSTTHVEVLQTLSGGLLIMLTELEASGSTST